MDFLLFAKTFLSFCGVFELPLPLAEKRQKRTKTNQEKKLAGSR
jgi:hypothetical protein